MRRTLTLAPLLGLLASGCALTAPTLTSAVPSTLTAAEAAPIATAMADLTTQRVPASSGAVSIEAPPGDTVLTPALTSDLRTAGYTVAPDGPHHLAYQVSPLDADVLLRLDLDGARATRLFTHTPDGLAPAGAFAVREVAR